MAIAEDKMDGKVWGLFKLPFRNSQSTTSSSSNFAIYQQNYGHGNSNAHSQVEGSGSHATTATSVSSVARSLLPTRRRLKLDPSNKLYFPYEPGKQVRSAVKIKNTSKSHVAFKFQTTAPKSCFMRPPGAILAPGESIIATVFKFVEHPENNEKPMDQKSRVKFKIMSLKVKGERTMASMAATRSFAFCTSSPAPSFRCPNTKYAQSQSFLRLNFRLLKQNHRKLNVVQASAPGLYSADQFELTSGNVDKVLDNVRPYLIADGGNVDVISVEDGVVSLKLQGACGNCPSSSTTMKMGIERVLKEKFGDAIKDICQVYDEQILETTVEAVNGHLDILRPSH